MPVGAAAGSAPACLIPAHRKTLPPLDTCTAGRVWRAHQLTHPVPPRCAATLAQQSWTLSRTQQMTEAPPGLAADFECLQHTGAGSMVSTHTVGAKEAHRRNFRCCRASLLSISTSSLGMTHGSVEKVSTHALFCTAPSSPETMHSAIKPQVPTLDRSSWSLLHSCNSQNRADTLCCEAKVDVKSLETVTQIPESPA